MKDTNLERFLDILKNGISKAETTTKRLSKDRMFDACFNSKNGKMLLFFTIEMGKTSAEFTKALLRAGVCPNSWNNELKVYPIHFAAKLKNASAMRLLLHYGANINCTLKNGRSALHICAYLGYKEGTDILLKNKQIEIDIKDKKGNQTPLYLAVAKSKSYSIAVDLISHGADLEHICFRKSMKQHIAIHLPTIDLDSLIKKAKPNTKAMKHPLLIHLSNIIDEAAIVSDPLRYDSLLEQFRSYTGRLRNNPLCTEAYYNVLFKLCDQELTDYVKVFWKTLNTSIRSKSVTESEKSALLIAAHRGNLELIKMLLENNVNQINNVDKETKETLLHLILKKDSCDPFQIEKWTECVEFLFDSKLCSESTITITHRNNICKIINNQDILHNTALHHAAKKWPTKVLSSMLRHGANIGTKNRWNEVPLRNISWYIIDEFLNPADHFSPVEYNDEDSNSLEVEEEKNDNENRAENNGNTKELTVLATSVVPIKNNKERDLLLNENTNKSGSSASKAYIGNDIYLADTIIDTADLLHRKIPKEKRVQALEDASKYNAIKTANSTSTLPFPIEKKLEKRPQMKKEGNFEPICELLFSLRRNREHRSMNTELRFFLLFVLIHTWFVFHSLNFKRDKKLFGIIDLQLLTYCDLLAEKHFRENVLDFCYYCYVLLSSIILIFTLLDWKADILTIFKDDRLTYHFERLDKKDPPKNQNKYCRSVDCYCGRKIEFKHILSVLSSNWKELGLVYLMLVLMQEKENYLWKGMFTLLFLVAVRELYQIWRAVKRWLLLDIWLYRENWMGLAMIFFISIQLFTYYDKRQDCVEYKIHMAAFAMGVSWNKLFTVVINHHFFSR